MNIIGKRFHSWKVLAEDRSRRTKDGYVKVMWKCQCRCGKVQLIERYDLTHSKTRSCNACAKRGGYGEISGFYWANVKQGAKRRNITFSLSIKRAWELFVQQEGRCALSGVELVFTWRSANKEQTASLDRIDSSKGYVIENVQWVHKDINNMKQAMTESKFIELCTNVVMHRGT